MVQVHSGPFAERRGVIAQLVERQLCKLDVRSSSLLSSILFEAKIFFSFASEAARRRLTVRESNSREK